MERRNFLKSGATATLGAYSLNLTGTGSFSANEENNEEDSQGAQRHSISRLKNWEKLKYGMFIHFGMSTFLGEEMPDGKASPLIYNPVNLDVDQWIRAAKQAGMKYAVLTAKHVAGHCLWPSKYNEYHVGNSGNRTDVVAKFVDACNKHGVLPGLYYCSWDNHNLFGSKTRAMVGTANMYTTQKYRDFQLSQVEELLTNYGKIEEVWIDIPGALGQEGKLVQYEQIASLQPDAVIMLNNGIGAGNKLDYSYTWPTDLMAIERYLPRSKKGYNPWFDIPVSRTETKKYYLPGEVCDTIGYEWFYNAKDPLRKDRELLGMRFIADCRKTNFLLDVPPNPKGVIPEETVSALMRLEENYTKFI